MKKRFEILVVCLLFAQSSWAHVSHLPSVHDTVHGILTRIKKNLSIADLKNLDQEKLLAFMTGQERKILATGFLYFQVSRPVDIYLAVDPGDRAPFWLRDEGFTKTNLTLNSTRDGAYEIWRKSTRAKEIKLGVNSLLGGGKQYLVFVKGDTRIDHVYPGQLRTAVAKENVQLYVDRSGNLSNLPAELNGATLLQTSHDFRNAGQLLGILLLTKYPSSKMPDQIVLSWEEDPKTTQTITWRTDSTVTSAAMRWQEKRLFHSFKTQEPSWSQAKTERLVTEDIVNDPVNHRHQVTLQDLTPATTYVYSVGDTNGANWSDLFEFSTAPADVQPFSFMYLGDAQNGLERWGSLMATAQRMRPDISFILMAGDLVNRGAQRDDWDNLFFNATRNFASKPLMPAIGNHEYQGGFPELYLKLFNLPANGPEDIDPERAYSFEYSNALFVILDSNRDFAGQARWLENILAASKATWKFVMYHHPAYSSSPNRNNTEVQTEWVPLFDKYHVDMVLQGHDHAYLRTYPMNNHQRVASPKEGTVYVVSVSGTKMYEQGQFDYTEKGFTNTSTFQILDVQVMRDRLLYKSYDDEGKIVDELIIQK